MKGPHTVHRHIKQHLEKKAEGKQACMRVPSMHESGGRPSPSADAVDAVGAFWFIIIAFRAVASMCSVEQSTNPMSVLNRPTHLPTGHISIRMISTTSRSPNL